MDGNAQSVVSPTSAPARIPAVLICEDSPDERKALSIVLQDQGYSAHEAGSGHACIELLKSVEIHVLLLDLHMSGGDGFDVLHYVQEHRRGLPVILLSGMPPDAIQHEMHRLRKMELPPLLLKPVNIDQLLELIEMALSGEIPGFEDIPTNDQPTPESA